MSTRTETFNGTKQFGVVGHYFELLAVVNPVDVVLYAEGDRVIARDENVSTGYFHERRGLEPFVRVEITTDANEEVTFLHTDGTSGSRGSTDVSDRAGRQLGIVSQAGAHTHTAPNAGAAAANALAANTNRKYLLVQNPSTARTSIWVRCDGTAASAAAGSIELLPGGSYEPRVAPTGAVSIINGDAGANIAVTVVEG